MPALGFPAVPLPTKIRKMLPGCQVALALGAAALGADTWAARGVRVAGSPVLVVAARVAVRVFIPSSRRLAAATVHASGAAAGVSPVLRDPSEDSGVALTAVIAAAARGGAVLGLRGAEDAARTDTARAPGRAAPWFGAAVFAADSEALAPAEPDEPAEPVVSANASGIATTAEPTPNATANAPTRPTTTKPDINDSSTRYPTVGHHGQRR
jgi:hypothetical protein